MKSYRAKWPHQVYALNQNPDAGFGSTSNGRRPPSFTTAACFTAMTLVVGFCRRSFWQRGPSSDHGDVQLCRSGSAERRFDPVLEPNPGKWFPLVKGPKTERPVEVSLFVLFLFISPGRSGSMQEHWDFLVSESESIARRVTNRNLYLLQVIYIYIFVCMGVVLNCQS